MSAIVGGDTRRPFVPAWAGKASSDGGSARQMQHEIVLIPFPERT